MLCKTLRGSRCAMKYEANIYNRSALRKDTFFGILHTFFEGENYITMDTSILTLEFCSLLDRMLKSFFEIIFQKGLERVGWRGCYGGGWGGGRHS